MQLDPEDEEFIILKKDQKEFVDNNTKNMCDKDACMPSYFGTPSIPA